MLLRDTVYRKIRRAILTCEFLPGQELREQALAEKYRVSRSPVRDSLLRLEQENLVTVLPRQGYRVNPISFADAENVAAMRLIIEPACAAAAARMDDAAVRSLDRFREMPESGSPRSAYADYNDDFHRAIADACGNPRLAAVAHDLVDQCERIVRTSNAVASEAAIHGLVREHGLMIDAIQAHDPDQAFRLTYEHGRTGHSVVLMALRRTADERDARAGLPVITE